MPRISSFYGIVIYMYWPEHGEPHFHAEYGEYDFAVRIRDGALLQGHPPRKVLRMVQEWTGMHTDELLDNWARCRRLAAPRQIAPLP